MKGDLLELLFERAAALASAEAERDALCEENARLTERIKELEEAYEKASKELKIIWTEKSRWHQA